MSVHGDSGSVCAVVVTYRSLPTLAENLRPTLAQVDHLVLVNNSPDITPQPLPEAFLAQHHHAITLLDNPENGLAKAQNMGISHAREAGYDWVLLLDDDSTPEPEMVEHLLGAYRAHPKRLQLGLVAPDIVEPDHPPYRYPQKSGPFGFRRIPFTTERCLENILYVCASGSLIPTRLCVNDVGLMDESYFIYCVDVEFCLRLNRKKYGILVVRDARLHHRVGNRSQHAWLGTTVSTTNHSPNARYYQYRNRVRLWRNYGLAFPGFLMFDYLRMNWELLRVVLFEKEVTAKLRAMATGFMDGLRGHDGKRLKPEDER